MKLILKYPLLAFLFIVFLFFGILQCKKNEIPPVDSLTDVKNEILKNNNDFLQQTNHLIDLVSHNATEKTLQEKFGNLRKTYKKMEWAVEYFLPHSARFINGAALPEIEMSEHTEIEPEGLQALEELLYPYKPSNKDEVIRLLKKLLNKSNIIKTNFLAISIGKDQVFDALRQEVFRISSLGIAGFDTPISGAFLQEMPYAMESVKKVLSQISTEKSKHNSYTTLSTQIDAAINVLKQNSDKITFNYAVFIPSYLNKISETLLQFRKEERIPEVEVTTVLRKNAATFYSKNAFDANAFTAGKEYTMTPQKTELGKELFYDPILSNNSTRSCSTCHVAEKAFTDGKEKSMSLQNVALVRNTPSLNYSAFQHGQFWDMRKDDLEGQSSDVITNKEEMHGDLNVIIAKINNNKKYNSDFKRIFGSQKAQVWQLQNVLATYIRSLATFSSDFDEYMRGNNNAMSERQKKGFNLFMGKAQCAICHFLPLFNGTVPPDYKKTEQEVLGVAENFSNEKLDRDPGRGKFHETVAFLQNSFKTPTLRNINKTAPYMHNGGYKTLKQVMEFYNKGGGVGFGFKIENQTLSDTPLHLTDTEMDDVIEFLKALDDKK
ncbi:cytochrome-c peroxidase [Chryseobacterium oryzae]|uniref:Cytochrome C peroxidase n=1 Tax=Chryseobacterium oryzae TaxID=2929799 RepID=A0ABY4BHF3_9FLAO|nr:cytochrome c peroxidase [Chryseobacterium oryzae]UOE37391.1 cytochrome C peroxidase [Chryseobacterium oryzae]